MTKLTTIDGKLRRYTSSASYKLVLTEEDDTGCCCGGGECRQLAIKIPGYSDGTVLGDSQWTGINVSISGSVIHYGDYFGAPNGFWQGHDGSGTESSSVNLTFSGKIPAKIIVICTAMNTPENQAYSVSGSAIVEISGVTPIGAYPSGVQASSGTINRAPPGEGDSRFLLTVTETSRGSITGFNWSHNSPVNLNGMVNAIFVCAGTNDTFSL